LLEVQFDVIILTEIWTTNIEFYENILPGCNFYYDLRTEGKVGGIGLYVKMYILIIICLHLHCQTQYL